MVQYNIQFTNFPRGDIRLRVRRFSETGIFWFCFVCLFVLIYLLLFSSLGFSPLIYKRDQTSDRARARRSEGFSSGSKRDSVMTGTIPCIKPSNNDSDKTLPCKKKVNHFLILPLC